MGNASLWGGLASLLLVVLGWRAPKWARASTFAFALAGATVLLIAVGGMVSGTHNGLACPDWPTCFGSMVPEMTGGVEFEHTHRLAAAAVLGLTAGLVRRLWMERAERPQAWPMFRLGVAAAALVALQAGLGALTVVWKLPTAVVVAHLATAMVFLSLLVFIGWRSREVAAAPDGVSPWVAAAPAAVFAQLVLGALVRHLDAGLACADEVLSCRGALWPWGTHHAVQVHMVHRAFALVVTAVVIAAAVHVWRRAAGRSALRALALALPALVLAQVTLGVLSVLSWLSLWAVTLHLANGALLLCATFSLWLVARGVGGESRRQAREGGQLAPSVIDGFGVAAGTAVQPPGQMTTPESAA